MALVLASCGGGSSSTTTQSSGSAVTPAKAQLITSGEEAIGAAIDESAHIVGHPDAVREVRRLLQPLIIAKTLQVKPSDQLANAVLAAVLSRLDNAIPGLTTGTGSADEQLDEPTLHRFLKFGRTHPAKVFEPDALQGVEELERFMHGLPANAQVSVAGKPAVTTRDLLTREIAEVGRYWPDLAGRLRALRSSLR